jgi:ribonuclease T1
LHPIFRTIRHPFRRRGGFPALVVLLLAVLLLAACGAAATDTPAPQPGAPARATATPRATQRQFSAALGRAIQTIDAATASAPSTISPSDMPAQSDSATATVRASSTPRATPRSVDGLPVIAYDDLPREAHETLRLIERGGPFPYRQDGSTFQNRERLLPRKPGGYYREYTVETPGEDDRGARRIVAGEEGELYYTDDHYDSFRRVMP